MTVHLFGVHGINTPEDEPWAKEWSDALGAPFEVHAGRWEATDSGARDVIRMLTNKEFRDGQVHSIAGQMQRFARITQGKPRVVVAHSMGSAITCAAERLLAKQGINLGLKTVHIGSPLSHPITQTPLEMAGLSGPGPSRPKFFYNLDDPICASSIWGVRLPPWADCIRSAAFDSGDVEEPIYRSEHWHRLYLANSLVRSTILRVARSSV